VQAATSQGAADYGRRTTPRQVFLALALSPNNGYFNDGSISYATALNLPALSLTIGIAFTYNVVVLEYSIASLT